MSSVRDLMPTAFAQGCTLRIVHWQPDARGEFETIEERLADGLGAARRALADHVLPAGAAEAVRGAERRLREQVLTRRRLLGEHSRGAIEAYACALRDWADEHGATPETVAVLAELDRALEASHRVQDLLGAEDDIGGHRGLMR